MERNLPSESADVNGMGVNISNLVAGHCGGGGGDLGGGLWGVYRGLGFRVDSGLIVGCFLEGLFRGFWGSLGRGSGFGVAWGLGFRVKVFG